ncbi:hypothetical protein [Bacillus sinesaloumensis]|uniref:hypothetical protein n=1 Tax=Litchfieldia sinesaloumensis TaxID=1926280 RepID=UPI00098887F6|nr:hypothetical protein [Bacillus sinesaloumensis]
MKKIVCLTMVCLLLSSATVSALSWAYAFVVHDGKVYEVKEDMTINQTELGKMIGKVKTKADEYTGDYYGNASNYYDIGTRYYEITGISTDEAIAVEVEKDHYAKAVYAHDSPFHLMDVLTNFYFLGIAGIAVIVLVGVTVLRSKQR